MLKISLVEKLKKKGVILTSYVLFNFLLSILFFTIFIYNFNLSYKSIIIHLIFVFYCLSIILFFLLISTRFFKTKLLSLIVLIGYQFFILLIYFSYYIGKERLGLPLTFEQIIPYATNITSILNFEFISPIKFLFILVILIGLILLQYKFLNKINIEFNYLWLRFFTKNKKIKLILILGLFFLPLLIRNFEPISSRIKYYKNTEPILTFFYINTVLDKRFSGDDNIIIKKEYPSNLKFEKKNVILIICDALRADYLGSYGNEQNVSPFLDSLVNLKGSLKLDNHYSTTSWSYNGISNTLSSSYNLYKKNFFVHDVLKKQGYDINFILSGDFKNFYGLEKHIRTKSVDYFYDGDKAYKENSKISFNDDKEIVLYKLNKIKKSSGVPTFFYLHYMSAHQVSTLTPLFKKLESNNIDLSASSYKKLALRNNYNNKILQLDSYLKETFKILKEKNYLENSIVIITSDHGQSLGEKGKYFHSESTYLSEIKIPLIILPSNETKLIDNQVLTNQLDVGPTIIDLLKIPKPENWKGKSIFKKKSAPIFQHQRDYYSVIWKKRNLTYQFMYNKKNLIEEVFNISEKSNPEKNIINTFPPKEIDSLKQILFQFYNIKT